MRRPCNYTTSRPKARRHAGATLLALGVTVVLTAPALATTKSRTTTWYRPSNGPTTPTSQLIPAGNVSMTLVYSKRTITSIRASWSTKDPHEATHLDFDFTRKGKATKIQQGATTDGSANSGQSAWSGSFRTSGKGTVCATLWSRNDSPHNVCITF